MFRTRRNNFQIFQAWLYLYKRAIIIVCSSISNSVCFKFVQICFADHYQDSVSFENGIQLTLEEAG